MSVTKKSLKNIVILVITVLFFMVLSGCNSEEEDNNKNGGDNGINIENPQYSNGTGGSGSVSGSGNSNTTNFRKGSSAIIKYNNWAGTSERAAMQATKFLAEGDQEGFDKLRFNGELFSVNRGTSVRVSAIYGDLVEIQVGSNRRVGYVQADALELPKN